MSADILSDVLRTVRLRGAVFYDVVYGDEWVAEAPPARVIAPAVMPGIEHVIEYHVMVRGRGWAGIVGLSPVQLATGDVVMFPQGDAHVMSSAPGMRADDDDLAPVFETARDPKPIPVAWHRGALKFGARLPEGEIRTNVLCGFIGCDIKPFNPLIATLPRLLHLPGGDGRGWVVQVLRQAVAESSARRPGGEAMLQRISEMVFVDAVRTHVERLPEESTGWLAGLRDRHVGRALAAMHEAPTRDWTVEALASASALSRSALHDRFSQLIGMAPMQYLANWRMQLAARLLRDTGANVASVALEVGYDSEAAFARAFKRLVGVSPAAWRRGETALIPARAMDEDASAVSA